VTELADFLDAEYGLQRGEAAWRESAIEAGEKLVTDLGVEPAELRGRLVADRGMRLLAVKQWLRIARLGAKSNVLPGTAMANGFRMIGAVATIGGLLIGFGTGRAALASAVGEPVNLWLCLGLLVLLQALLLFGAAGAVIVAKVRGRQWLSGFTNLLKWLHRWSWAKRVSSSELLQALPRTQKVERWVWLGLTQRFAVFFNLGALIAFMSMLLFTELQFGWATTPTAIGAQHMEALVDMLAAPWGWAFPEKWVPNENVIAATQWDSLAASFKSPNADGRVWWPFVMMNLLLWGLIPRVVLLQWANNNKRRALDGLDWNHRRLQDLFEIMLPSAASACASAGKFGAGAGADAESPLAADAAKLANAVQSAEGVVLVAWGSWQSGFALQAGGRDLSADATLITELGTRGLNTVQVVVEAGEAPDKRFTSFVAKLRSEVGRSCLIQVCPVELAEGVSTAPATSASGSTAQPVATWQAPSDRNLLIWRRTLATLRDDHLHVSGSPPATPGGA
jgi:hypothetical protein